MGDRKKTNINQRLSIAIFTTGGTILSEIDRSSGVVLPKFSGEALIKNVGEISEEFNITHVEFCNKPGSDLTLEDGLKLSTAIRDIQKKYTFDGVVVLQGSDTMDEIPYFISLTTETKTPIVFTGAMKSNYDSYSDATGNLLGAARVAVTKSARNRGVLVYFNETVFSAQDIYKEHASRIDAFASRFGPIGSVINKKVHFFREISRENVYEIVDISAKVPLIKVNTGIDAQIINAMVDGGASGLVIEGYGSGNVPEFLVDSIENAIKKGVTVIVTTRCTFGESYACYGYKGGGAHLEKLGVILSGESSGIKSRIKLAVMLSAGAAKEEVISAFRYE